MTDLTHKTAMVTGAASGIGLAVTRALAQRGCKLVLFDLDHEGTHRVAASLNANGPVAFVASGSVADPAAVKRAFEIADQELGRIDILINNAGITGNCAALDLDIATWNRILSVNLTGSFLCAQAAGSRMQASGGVIVNISSIYGLVAAPHRVAYGATKAAIVMMTKSLAVEWASAGIRVNCVAPGYVETPGTAALAEARKIDLAALRKRTPQGRLAQPEEIAEAIVMLCQDSMAHVTGQVLAVDGGWTAYGYL
jgi:NAD(P)-dependent dehydrogenase (short-subunit alcohol dehydrogenase family)